MLLCAVPASPALAQDVEMLGRRYGTRPPQGYYDAMQRDRSAFTFRRGRAQRLRVETRSFYEGAAAAPALSLGPRDGPVVGTFEVPVLLGLYDNSGTPPFTTAQIEGAYFSGQPGSITHYYDEVSGGLVTLSGDVQPWQRVARDDTVYTMDESGIPFPHPPLGGGGAGNFVYELLELQTGVPWEDYDNDGPDGMPNSGDDDGFVDVVAVIHPTRGAECGGSGTADRIWSHRWSLSSTIQQTFDTGVPRTGGGSIRVDDYTIQPSVACSGSGLNQIGVFTHELGHAFGLPDLYDTDQQDGLHAGAGTWDLMASGSWGCDNASPSSPCHMGAWSKEQLGWVNVVTLAPDADHGTLTLTPVEEPPHTIYRVDANDGSDEYFLIEYRAPSGYDGNLHREGLLVWQIDPDWIANRWAPNTVNGSGHMGVWLRQADGRDDLGASAGARGDAGDPFPGQTGNVAFHAVSNPAATSYQGGPTGLTIVDIAVGTGEITFRVLTRFSTISVNAIGAAGVDGLFTVDGASVDSTGTTWESAPFVPHTIEVVDGETIAPGERRPFLRWTDAPDEPRTRQLTTPLADVDMVAEFGPSQYALDFTLAGGVGGVAPATILTTPAAPDLWFEQGIEVTIEARTTPGFAFLGWSGDLAGQANPAVLTMSTPRSAGADFELLYAISTARVDLTATHAQDLQLVAEAGTPPYAWRVVQGALPQGLSLSSSGRITGASIDTGTFAVTLEAVDAIGLPAMGAVTLEVGMPSFPLEALVSPFLLSGPALTPVQLSFLNRQGNGVAGYDIGDFRAWLQRNPTLPLSADFEPSEGPRTIVLPMTAEPKEGARR